MVKSADLQERQNGDDHDDHPNDCLEGFWNGNYVQDRADSPDDHTDHD